jgi:hypothetical protein
MEPPQLSYRIHPASLEFVLDLFDSEKIPCKLKFHSSIETSGYFDLKPESELKEEHNINALEDMVRLTVQALNEEKKRMTYLIEIGRDYEMIKSDMKALMMGVTLLQNDLKPHQRDRIITMLLESRMASDLKTRRGKIPK